MEVYLPLLHSLTYIVYINKNLIYNLLVDLTSKNNEPELRNDIQHEIQLHIYLVVLQFEKSSLLEFQ